MESGENAQPEVYDIDNVEIFKTGKWNGEEYSEADLDEMVRAFNEAGSEIKPYLKLGHDEKQTLLQKDGLPSAGWITSLRRDGQSLKAKFSSVPKKIKELIDKKAYGRMSSEIYWNLKKGDNNYKRALRAVALLGASTPAVTSLDDFITLYNTENDCDEIKICNSYEDIKMHNEDIDVRKYEAQIDELNDKLKIYEEQNGVFKKENAELKQYIEAEKKGTLKKEAVAVIGKAVEEGKILPVQVSYFMALALSDGVSVYSYIEGSEQKKVEGTGLELVKNIIASSEKQVDFTEKSQNVEIDRSVEESEGDVLDKKVSKYAEKHNVTYVEAFDAIAYGGNE